MHIPQIDEETGRLIAEMGYGRQWINDEGGLFLTFERQNGGKGLRLQAVLHGDAVEFWVDETQWCQWVTPVLTTPSFEMVPHEFSELLAIWTLAEAVAGLDTGKIAWPQATCLTEERINQGIRWRLRAIRGERTLDLYVNSAPNAWMNNMIEHMTPIAEEQHTDPIVVGVSLVVGWILLEAALLNKLAPGDALFFHHHSEVANRHFFLFTCRPIASLYQDEASGMFIVEALMNGFDDWIDIAPPPDVKNDEDSVIANTVMAITAEVARFEISLTALMKLEVDDVLPSHAAYPNSLVTLKAGGRVFAQGILVNIGGRLAVKVENLV